VPFVTKSGILKFLELSGPAQVYNGKSLNLILALWFKVKTPRSPDVSNEKISRNIFPVEIGCEKCAYSLPSYCFSQFLIYFLVTLKVCDC
jgi:hypothetical protein